MNHLEKSLVHSDIMSLENFVVMSGKRKRPHAESFSEETYADRTNSESNSSDEPGSGDLAHVLNTPRSYMAVENLFEMASPANHNIKHFLKEKIKNKESLKDYLSKVGFFKFFSEKEYGLLRQKLKSSYSYTNSSSGVPTDKEVSEFFENCFKKIQTLCFEDWLSPNSTLLYIPAGIVDFHLRPEWHYQLEKHQPVNISDDKYIDFIITRLHPDNWHTLFQAFAHRLPYCPVSQLSYIVQFCADKKLYKEALTVLSQSPYRTLDIFDHMCELFSQNHAPEIISQLQALFFPWLFTQNEDYLKSQMALKNLSTVKIYLLSSWVEFRFSAYTQHAQTQKSILAAKAQWYINSPEYKNALDFFEKMQNFTEKTIIWAAQFQQLSLLHEALDHLKNNPLLTAELDGDAAVSRSLESSLKIFQSPLSSSLKIELMQSLRYWDIKHSALEPRNCLWRAWLKIWAQTRPESAVFKAELDAVIAKLGAFIDIHNHALKDDMEHKSFMMLFVETFYLYPEIFIEQKYTILLDNLVVHNYQLGTVTCDLRRPDKSHVLIRQSSYAGIEKFILLFSQIMPYLSQEQKDNYTHFFLSQDFINDYSGLTSLYLIVERLMPMLQQQEEHAFFDEVLRFLLDVDCLTEVSVDTVYRFLTAYRQITDEQSLQHTAQQLCEQLAVQSQSSHSHLISVLQRFAGAAELSNPQPLSFSIAPPAHLNPVCLIERSCHPKKIVRRIMSFAPSHFG